MADVREATAKEKEQKFSKEKTTSYKMPCEHCGVFIHSKAKTCPNPKCGKPIAPKGTTQKSGGKGKRKSEGIDFEKIGKFLEVAGKGDINKARELLDRLRGIGIDSIDDHLTKYEMALSIEGNSKLTPNERLKQLAELLK